MTTERESREFQAWAVNQPNMYVSYVKSTAWEAWQASTALTLEATLDNSYPHKAYNIAFFCLHCGQLWARLRRPNCLGWYCHNRSCASCPTNWWGEFPGTLADPYEVYHDGHGVADLPQDLLEREFTLLAGVDNSTVLAHTSATIPYQRAPSMELTARIAELRSKILSNTVTKEELREACAALRADRAGAAERRAITKAKAAPVDGTALLAKLAAFTKS